MGFLKRLFSKRNSAPDWAKFMGDEEYSRFIEAVQSDLARRGGTFDLDAAGGSVRVPGPSGPNTLGLMNLAQHCHQTARESWAEVVRQHFDTLLQGTPKTVEMVESLGKDFSRAKEYLKVRVFPSDYAAHLEATVSQPVAEDLIAVLVYDLPDSVASAHPKDVEKWGVPLHDLFQLGLRNVRAEGLMEPERIDLGGDAYLDQYEDPENFFSASHVLLLHEYFDPQPELGFLVSVPHRHGMVVHPILDAGALISLQALIYLTPRLYEQGPGSITPSIYWCRSGLLTRLPYETGANSQVNFYPPASFQEQVLERISSAG